ncbi:MAG: hypothetical protein KDD42_07755 [Bdellovibrionales bacterium]|nr:hypothetical protein [Bdellovibrionales bacterium]
MENFFTDFCDTSRVWIYVASRDLRKAEEDLLAVRLEEFFEDWKSHGDQVRADARFLYSRFLIIAADQASIKVSGCAIDTLFRMISDFSQDLDLKFSVSSRIFFRQGTKIAEVDDSTFEQLVKDRQVTPETVVFNNAISTLGELRSHKWETTCANSWHSKRFDVQ